MQQPCPPPPVLDGSGLGVGAHHCGPPRLLADGRPPPRVQILQPQSVLLAPLRLLEVQVHHRHQDPVQPAPAVQDPLAVDPQWVEVAGAEVRRLQDLGHVGHVQSQPGATDGVLRCEDGSEAWRVVDAV